jgi:uncharacterized protein YndB with AHSA1/START domain
MNQKPIRATVQMLIRRPAAEVFEAFINPEITTKFWFTKSSGRLETGKQIQWDWEMYGVSTQVDVKAIEPNRRILIEWDGGDTAVEWQFSLRGADATFVTVTNYGFKGSPDEIVAQALDSTGGFTIVLCGLKAWLEHNIQLNLVADRAPDNLV